MKKKTACILVLMLILTLVCAFPALSSEPVSGESLAEVDVDASAFWQGRTRTVKQMSEACSSRPAITSKQAA